MSGYSPLYTTSPRDSSHGSPPLRSGSRSGATPNRVPRLDRLDHDLRHASTARAATPAHASLHLTNLVAPSTFARPSYAMAASTSSSGGGNPFTNGRSSNHTRRAPLSPSRSGRRKEASALSSPAAAASRSGRHSRGQTSTPSRHRSGRTPTSRSAANSPAAEMEKRQFALVTPPPNVGYNPSNNNNSSGSVNNNSGYNTYTTNNNNNTHNNGAYYRGSSDGSALRGRNPLRQEEEKGRRTVTPRGGSLETGPYNRPSAATAATNTGATANTVGGVPTLSSSPLYSTLTSSASGNGAGGGSGAVASHPTQSTGNTNGMSFSPMPPPMSGGLNPFARLPESPAEASVSVSGAAVAVATTPTSLGNVLPMVPSKEHCSQCKVEDEVLYLCPCGLARYCSTTCQRLHWPTHRGVCCNGVRTVSLSWRRCDWCGLSSQGLRRCGCGTAYYCDVHCQRADWPFHRLVCSTVTSEAIVAALLGGPAPRTTREAATQTAHWQINVPVLRSLARADAGVGGGGGAADGRGGVSGYASTSLPTSQQYGFTGSDSFGEARFTTDNDSTANNSSFPRSNRTQPPPWEHNSQFPGDSVYTETTLMNSRSALAANASYAGAARQHADPAQRLSRVNAGAGGGGGGGSVSPRTPSGRYPQLSTHHRPSSVYESLYLTINSQEPPSPSTVHFRSDPDASPTTSKGMGHSSVSFAKTPTFSGATAGSGNRHSYAMSEAEGGPMEGGAMSNAGVSATSSFAPVRDQPSLLALAAASQRKIESDEQREWLELYRQFLSERVSMELRVLPKLEEEQRMAILKEEVMWCVVTGSRTAKELRQRVLGKSKK